MNWVVLQRRHFFVQKNVVLYHNHMETWQVCISLGLQQISICHDLCHPKRRITIVMRSTWPKLILCNFKQFILHTYSLAPNASKLRYILFSLRGISSWILPHFEPNDYHCSKGVHFTAEYMFFSGLGLLLLHPIWIWSFPKGYKNMRKAYFPALATSPPLNLEDLKQPPTREIVRGNLEWNSHCQGWSWPRCPEDRHGRWTTPATQHEWTFDTIEL